MGRVKESCTEENIFELHLQRWVVMWSWIKIRIGVQVEFAEYPEGRCKTTCWVQRIMDNFIFKKCIVGKKGGGKKQGARRELEDTI